MTLYEVSTIDKVMRSCAENEQTIRGERGDSELAFDKLVGVIEMPDSYKNHVYTSIDSVLFKNPSFKKYADYTYFNETALDYNLQPRNILDKNELFFSNYANELYKKLPLSYFDNVPLRELDSNCNLYILNQLDLLADNSLDFLPQKMDKADERDFFIKRKEKVDEDNYIFDIPKEDDARILEFIEKDDEVIKNIRELNKEEILDIREKEKINLENYLQLQKRKWMATVPTVLEYYNSGIQNPSNKFML